LRITVNPNTRIVFVMKNIPCILLATLSLPLCLLSQESTENASTPKSPEEAAVETAPTIDATPYQWDRFSKMLSKSPFEFDVPPEAAPEPIPPMDGWMISGISGTEDYVNVTIIHETTSQRVSMTKYTNPDLDRKKGIKSGGDAFKLIGIEFEPGKPKNRKSAKAYVQKNDDPAALVTWKSKADSMKPMSVAPNIQLPAMNAAVMGGGGMGGSGRGAMPNGGMGGGAPQGINPAQMGGGGVNMNVGGVGGSGQQIVPGMAPQPGQAGVNQPAGNVSNGQQQLLDLLNKNRGQNPNGAGGGANGQTPGSSLGRRRVVLPTQADQAPAPPNP
jgi:hypothetical protein